MTIILKMQGLVKAFGQQWSDTYIAGLVQNGAVAKKSLLRSNTKNGLLHLKPGFHHQLLKKLGKHN